MRTTRLTAATLCVLVLAGSLTACLPMLPPLPGGPWLTAAPVDEWPDPPAPPRGECPWESVPDDGTMSWAEVETSGGRTPDPNVLVANTEAVALDPHFFWQLIESIPSSPQPEDFTAAASALAGCSAEDVLGFEARLTLALYDLDGPENLDWFEANDPSGLGFASDDVFLYARCATVLGGRESWEAAVRERTLDWGADAPDVEGMAEWLLYVAGDAALAQGITLDDYSEVTSSLIPLSYETGSNSERWRG